MKKINSIAIMMILLFSSLLVMPQTKSDSTYALVEIIPNNLIGTWNGSSKINLSILITPPDGINVDTVGTELITFTPSILQCTKITWGNLFEDTTVQIKGHINNTAGTITNMVWGSTIPTDQPGYYVNLSFNIIHPGVGSVVIVNTSKTGVINNTVKLPMHITNFVISLYSLALSNEYPTNQSSGLPHNLDLGITLNQSTGQHVNLSWYSNATGPWKLIGIDRNVLSGRYYMSCYGVIDSPYNQQLQYLCSNYYSNVYHGNGCPGRNLGTIKQVQIYTPSFSGTIRPIFNGMLNGTSHSVSGISFTNITNDNHAPTEWKWADVGNLDVYTSSATTVYILVTYDIGFGDGVRIDWSANATDSLTWVNRSYWYVTEVKNPVLSNPIPYDTQTWLTFNPHLYIDVNDPNGDLMNISFWTNNSGPWAQIGTTQHGTNGTYGQATSFATYNRTFWWKVSAEDNNGHSTNETFRFTMRSVQNPPSNFKATTQCGQINLSWIKSAYSDYTRIQRRLDHYPTIISDADGVLVYNGTGSSVSDTSVNPGTKYYYSAWAFNNTDKTWSTTKSNALNFTAPNEPTDFLATKIDYSRIDLSWTKGTGTNTTLIRRKIGSYPTNQSDGTFIYNSTGSSYSNTGLGANITYYYRAWSYRVYYSCLSGESYNKTDVGPPLVTTQPATSVGDTTARLNANLIADGGETTTCGFIWENESGTHNTTIGTRTAGQSYYLDIVGLQKGTTYHFNAWAVNSFGFVSGYENLVITKPYEPTNLTVTDVGVDYISLSWDVGLKGADDTVVMRKTGSYPASPTDGIEAYFGGGNSISVGGLNSNVTYYFRAWSYTESVSIYSTNYDQITGKTIVGIPIITTQSATSINDYNATVHATLTDSKGETCVCGFRWGTSSGVYPNNVTVGSYTTWQSYSKLITGLSKGHTYYYEAWARNSGGTGYGSELSFITKPEEPQSFSAVTYGARQINLSWIKGKGTDFTRIQRKVGSYPTNMNDGTTCYNGTGNYYRNMEIRPSDPLLENTAYYYKAWSYNTTTSIYSTLYVSSFNTTKYLPTQTLSPSSQTNINRPPVLYITPNGTSPLTVWFYDETSDSTNETFGNSAERMFGYYAGSGTWDVSGTLWQNVNNTLQESDYAYSMVEGNSWRAGPYYVYSDTLEIDLTQPKFTKSFDLNLNYYAECVYPYAYFPVVSHIFVQYHDYTTGTWASVSKDFDTRPIGHGSVSYSGLLTLTLPQTKYVDAIRFYFSVANGGGSATVGYEHVKSAVSLYYIKFVPSTYISTQIKTSGETANAVFSSATKLNQIYSWTGRTANSIDSIYNTCSFTTEKIIYSNLNPVLHSIVDNTPSHTCSAMVNHTGGDTMNVYFHFYNYSSGHYQLGGTNLSVHNGTYRWVYPNSDQYGRTYYWNVSAWDGLDWYNQTFDFTVRSANTPNPPNYNLLNYNATVINITGISGDSKTNSITMRAKKGSYPTNYLDGTFLFNGTPSTYNYVGLDPNTDYYFRAWAWNRTDNVWSSPDSKILTTLGPQPPSFTLSKHNNTVIYIRSISRNDAYSDTVLIRAKIGSYPTSRTDGIFVMNSTASYINHTGLTISSNYFYSAWAYDVQTHWWGNPTQHSQKTNGYPTSSSYYPSGQISGYNPTLHATIGDYNPEDLEDVYFRTNASGTWTTIYSWVNGSQGTYTHPETTFHLQDWNYWWSVNVTDHLLWYNHTISFRTGSMSVPTVTAVAYNTTQINLSWVRADGTTATWITRKIDTYPINRADGTNVYYGAGGYYEDENLSPGQLYRYKVWSYNSTTDVFSTGNTTTQNLTKPKGPTNFKATSMNYRNISLSWDLGDGAQKTFIAFGEDSYPTNRNDGTLVYFDTGTSFLVGHLKPDDYLNYYTPQPGVDNIGVYIGGGDPFNNSCDGNTNTKWDLNENKIGNFSYILPLVPQRIKGFAVLIRDFYQQPGTDWQSAITGFEVYNGSWHTDWNGLIYDNSSSKEWHYHTSSKYYNNVTEIRFTAYTQFITPDLFEVLVGKLGYIHCFRAWSYVEKGGLHQYSDDYADAQNRTKDTPPNQVPLISDMHLLNGTIHVNPNPTFNVTIADPEGQRMNISWQYLHDGNWNEFASTTLVTNGTYYANPLGVFIGFNTTYYWRVNVSDTADVGDSSLQTSTNTSPVFSFTTRDMFIPVAPSYFNATAVAWNKVNLTFTFSSDKIYIERNTSSTWSYGQGQLVYLGVGTQYQDTVSHGSTIYYYQAWGWNNTDSSHSSTYLESMATTPKRPNEPPNKPITPLPTGDYLNVYNVDLSCYVTDPNGNMMNVSFYWQGGTYIGTAHNVANGTRASIHLPDFISPAWLAHDTTYNWYAVSNDTEYNNQSSTFSFKTCKAWDLNIDRHVDVFDVSLLLTYYGSNLVAGSQPWDINNDGHVDIFDVSILVLHYAENY